MKWAFSMLDVLLRWTRK